MMRVLARAISNDGDDVVVSARVEAGPTTRPLPETLWFSFPRRYGRWISDDLNGFAAALLPLAMTLGEDLVLDGEISPRLLRGLADYVHVQSTWAPTRFKKVEITAAGSRPAAIPDGTGVVASSFSGGIDSCYTLWRHLPGSDAAASYEITHCLMINGFDADSAAEDPSRFWRIQAAVEPVLRELGVELIVCRTNYMSFSDPGILKQSFGAMVTAPALVLGAGISTFFVPGSCRFDEFFRDGSHLLFDHLVATESMETVHDSSHVKRPYKTRALAGWQPSYSILRVCFGTTAHPEGSRPIANCGRCEKCIRTMTTLQIWGMLDRYATFTRKPTHLAIWRCFFGDKGARLHAREIMEAAWSEKRFGLWIDYAIAMVWSAIIKAPRGVLQRLHLALEERSEAYARGIRRLLPRLRRRAYWIRSSARRADRPSPTREPDRPPR